MTPKVPKPTVLNHLPLLYALFDMGGITTPAADAYEAHLFAQEQAREIEDGFHATLIDGTNCCGYPECCPQDNDPLQNPTEPALDEAVRDAAPL
jgi:hypothetical protein